MKMEGCERVSANLTRRVIYSLVLVKYLCVSLARALSPRVSEGL